MIEGTDILENGVSACTAADWANACDVLARALSAEFGAEQNNLACEGPMFQAPL
jgi:hypothetical protein